MIIVLSTYPDRRSAEKSASEIVERRLAACASMIATGRSYYRWKGKMEKRQEYLLLIKTTKKAYTRLERQIKKTHPHHVPEIIFIEVKGGQRDYLEWVRKSVIPGF